MSVPNIESQLLTAQSALALGYLTLLAMSQADDLGMGEEDREAAFSLLAHTLKDGLDACRAASAVLPAEVATLTAPAVR